MDINFLPVGIEQMKGSFALVNDLPSLGGWRERRRCGDGGESVEFDGFFGAEEELDGSFGGAHCWT